MMAEVRPAMLPSKEKKPPSFLDSKSNADVTSAGRVRNTRFDKPKDAILGSLSLYMYVAVVAQQNSIKHLLVAKRKLLGSDERNVDAAE